VILLVEGIPHLEDLDLQAFLKAITNISKMQASEKLDGAQLWFGLDKDGKLYTSRAGKRKSAENIYNEEDYPYYAANNGFRSTHAALKANEEDIKQILRPGDTVELEVLFGRQPNAVTYGLGGKNYIAFLRGVDGTQDLVVDQLANRLGSKLTKVNTKLVDTVDGEHLKAEPADLTFKFVGVPKLDAGKLRGIDLSAQLGSLKEFLEAKAPLEGVDISNFDLVTRSLGSFDKTSRPAAKDLKAKTLAAIMVNFKLPIKKELLSKFVHQVKSPLAADDLTPEEDIGIEGVVLREPGSEDQIKLVDKDAFTTINQFNHAVRGSLNSMVKTTDGDAPLESRGGMLGELKITIADLLGNRELARTQGAKKIFQTLKGKNPEETVKNVAGELTGGDDFLGTQKKVLALISHTQEKLATALRDFKAHKDSFQLKLKNGRSMGLSPEVIRRTLVAFAETKRDLDELAEKVGKSKNLAQLVVVLYGRIAKAVHVTGEEEPITEELLLEKRIFTDKTQYQGKDGWSLLNIYLATVMMSTVIYKENDRLGIRILKDKTHSRLATWHKEMSPLNFWGYIIWRINTPAAQKLVSKKVAKELFRHVRKVPPNWWRFLHMDLSFGRDVPIDWADHRKTLSVLQHFPAMNVDRVNSLLDGVFRYEELTFDEKVKLLGKLYFYVMQFIPISPLLTRIRAIQDQLLLNANGENYQMVKEGLPLLRLITEDDGAAVGNTVAASPAGASPVSATTPPPHTAMGAISNLAQRQTFKVKRRRWQDLKFKDPNKVRKHDLTSQRAG